MQWGITETQYEVAEGAVHAICSIQMPVHDVYNGGNGTVLQNVSVCRIPYLSANVQIQMHSVTTVAP